MKSEKMIINSNALDQYIDLLGEEEGAEFIIEIIDTFIVDAPNNIRLLNHSMAENDFVTFCRAAHTLKTGCGIVGATLLAENLMRLEETGAEGNLTSIGGLVEQCQSDFQKLKTELEMKKSTL